MFQIPASQLGSVRKAKSCIPAGLLAICALLPSCGSGSEREAVLKLSNACAISPVRPSCRGVRNVQVVLDGTSQFIHERVFDDGAQDIGVEILDRRTATGMTPEDLLAALHGRFTYQFRDIAIDQIGALFENYDVALDPAPGLVAGHPTLALTFTGKTNATNGQKTIVQSDAASGLPLQVTRLNSLDQLVYQMTFESVEIGNVVRTAEDPRTLPDAPPQQRSSNGQRSDSLGEFLVASDVLDGFVLTDQSLSSVSIGGQGSTYAVDRYTDGLQHLFVTQGDPEFTYSGETPFVNTNESEPAYAVTNMGPVTIVWGQRHGRALASFGPYDQTTLARVISKYHPAH